MAEDQDSANDIDEGGDAPEIFDDDESVTVGIQSTAASSLDDYDDDEPIEDYVVKLVVNEQSDGVLSPDLVNAAVTDINGNIISSNTKLYDSINGYTTALYDELNGNSTAITGSKRWFVSTPKTIIASLRLDDNPFYEEVHLSKTGSLSSQGWSTKKLIFAGLIALCILGIILAIVFFVIGKKFKKNKRSPPAGTTTTTKAVVTKGVSQDPKYQPVPNV